MNQPSAVLGTPRSPDLVIRGGTLITMDPLRRVVPDGAVCISGSRITYVGPSSELPSASLGAQEIDATGHAILPGLIDCHGHAGHGLTRMMGYARPDGWQNACEMFYARGATEEFWSLSATLMGLERLKFGVTTGLSFLGGGGAPLTGDMAIRSDDPRYGARHCEAIERLGTRDFVTVGPRTFPYPHHYVHWSQGEQHEVAVSFEDQLATCDALARHWHGKADGRIAVSIMSHTCHPASFERGSKAHHARVRESREAFALARQHDLLFTQDGHTRGTVEFAQAELGILGPRTLLSHCTDLSRADIDACSSTDTRVVHNPSAVASVLGRCPVPELLDAGVTVAIASDGQGPDRSCDLFRHMTQAMRQHRFARRDPGLLPSGKVLEMITIDAARALGVDSLLGSLEVGKQADVVLLDVRRPHLTPFLMPVEQIVNFANGTDITTALVGGRIVMRDREVTTLNEQAVLEAVERLARDTVARTQTGDLLASADNLWRASHL
jgi:cytosine/adenosine deaminase-related metal-dependent hydrolase